MEVWKKINGYENYEISDLGRVKSLKKYGFIILKNGYTSDGYVKINICKNGKYKSFTIHRLVANYFIKNTFNKETVNHINGIKTDNRFENLEWATRKEQSIHSFKNLLQKKTNNKIVLNTKTGIYYNSVVEASIHCNYKKSTLAAKLNGTRKNNTTLMYA